MSPLETSKPFIRVSLCSVLIQNCLILSDVQVGDKSKIKDAKVPSGQVIEEKSNITGESAE